MKKIPIGNKKGREMFLIKLKKASQISLFSLSFTLSIFAHNHKQINGKSHNNSSIKKDKVMCITIPKSGTHLLLKCLTLMRVKNIAYNYWEKPKSHSLNDLSKPIPDNLRNSFASKNQKSFSRHLAHSSELENFLNEHCFANFFMIRDPRAQLISQAKTYQRSRIGGNKRSVEDFALDMLLNRKENFLPLKAHLKHKNLPDHIVVIMADLFVKIGFQKFYQLFTPWLKAKNFYTVKFEKLVGAQGGGSFKEQKKEIQAIARHIGVALNKKKITRITKKLFGDSGTFSQGQIDSWKKYFTPAVTRAFKAQPFLMQLLIDLGYEKDNNW